MLSSLIVCNSDKPFSDQTETWWKLILYNNWTTSDNQLSGWTEKRSQSQICMKKRSWSLFSGLLSVWSTTASESWQNHYIWEINSGNWWDPPKTAMPTVSIHQEKGPNSLWQHLTACCTTNTSKLNELGYKILPHSPYSPDKLTTTSSRISSFCRENAFTTSRKCFPRVHQIPRHGVLHYRNKQTYLSLAIGKHVLIVVVLILINKDMFEPSYNDLKFTLQNCNYVCTNLIYSDSMFSTIRLSALHLGSSTF